MLRRKGELLGERAVLTRTHVDRFSSYSSVLISASTSTSTSPTCPASPALGE